MANRRKNNSIPKKELQREQSVVREETNPNATKMFTPTESNGSLSSMSSMTSCEDSSSLQYTSMEEGYRRKDRKPFDRNDKTFEHCHSAEICYRRTCSSTVGGGDVPAHAGGSNGGVASSMPSNQSYDSGLQLRTYSSGYNSGASQAKIWIEMKDVFGNELRRRKLSDAKLGVIKIELMEIAEKWKVSERKSNFKIICNSENFDLCKEPQESLHEPIGRSQSFTVEYY